MTSELQLHSPLYTLHVHDGDDDDEDDDGDADDMYDKRVMCAKTYSFIALCI